MSLRIQAELDARAIVEDRSGFGWPIMLTDPSGKVEEVTGLTNDISLVVDPDTGMLVSGRDATIAVSIQTLRAAGYPDTPRAVSQGLPWVVEFWDINGNLGRFKVSRTSPDRAIGLVVMHLEVYR